MDILDNIQPIEDLEHLKPSEKHDPIALEHFSAMEEIQEELLWTGRPMQKFSTRDKLELGSLILLFLALILGFLTSSITIQFFLKVLFFIFSIPSIWLFLHFHEKKRKNTFYGVSATSIWVHKHQSTLQQYLIKDLKQLVEHQQNITFLTQDNSYQILLQHVPYSYKVIQLLRALQPIPNTTPHDRTAG
ncbi:MAG: hypothetical protein ACRBFS_00350 [Aureispira sp.]